MFWECHVVTSSIEKLLDQPRDEIKLQDFLDETDLIQECLNQNCRLFDYLVQKNTMSELIHHLITFPSDENFRNANVVSELLSGDFQRIQESLLEKENLDLLYSFLTNNQQTLNPILASYVAKITNTLIIRKTNEIFQYFQKRQTFKDDFFRHADTTSIIDILYRLVVDSNEQRSNVIKWYEETNLIDGLIQQFLRAECKSAQMNIANLLSEFLRLAFDQPTGIDCDFAGPTLSATIERLLYNRTETNDASSTFNRFSSNNNDEEKKSNISDTENKLTPIILAEHILSKSNLEQIFDTLITRPIFIIHGCEFLETIFDLLSRHMPVPICIPLVTNKTENEQMQINDESDTSVEKKLNELNNLAKEPLVRIYLTLLEIIPSRLPSLIALLSSPSQPLIPSVEDNSQTVKYQFITEPLGSIRLNLIKFISKLIHTISNDYTGDHIYDIFKSNRLFPILIELFLRHIYNNFLHTQIHMMIRLFIHINSLAVKQSNDIWTRTILNNGNIDNSSFHYTNRCSYQLFQTLFNPNDANLIERLLDQYELNIASTKINSTSDEATTSALHHTRFASPNSGHIAQILRCLRDHASTFDNYSTYFKLNNHEQIDNETNVLEIRWQTALDYLAEDEKKSSAMHHTERTSSNFRVNSSTTNYLIQTNTDDSDASKRRHNFHLRSFINAARSYVDDEDDDDEIERFDIDDELMKNDQTSNERKVAEMKNISFEPQFTAVFDEQSLWREKDQTNKDDEKLNSAPTLPDLLENHRNQQEKHSLTTESNFEQLCSLRANDSGSNLFPFQSSSTIRDEAISNNDPFWQKHPIYLVNSTENQRMDQSSSSSSSEDEHQINDNDEDQSKNDLNIPEDENFFVEINENIQVNNMMDIFRRQPSNSTDDQISKQTIVSNPSENQTISFENNSNSLKFIEQGTQHNGEMNNEIDDEDLTMQDNFSFLIAKGMLKPS